MPECAAAEEFARSREAFVELEEWLEGPEAAALGHAELEEELGLRGRELQRLQRCRRTWTCGRPASRGGAR